MRRSFELDAPLDLAATLRLQNMFGAATWLVVDASGAWYAARTSAGTATVHLTRTGRTLHAQAWGDGAEVLLDEVPDLVGLHDGGTAAIPAGHPAVAHLARKLQGYRVGREGRVFSRLVSVALAQKVTGMNSKRALSRIAWKWGETAPGPRDDLRLLPTPRQLAAQPYYVFHPLGIERHRAELVHRIASRASALERAAGMSGPDAMAHLQKLPGIGPWTAAIVVGGALGYADAVPVGDYHVPNWVSWNLAREPRGDDARMLELLAPYAGRRGQVVRMLKGGGEAPPRYGARSEVRDIRGM